MYLPFPTNPQIRKRCGCSVTYNRDITCIDLHGKVTFTLQKFHYMHATFLL